MVTQPQPRPQRFVPTLDSIQACLVAIILRQGEPLIDPTRISLALSRPDVEAAAGRTLTFEYTQDELNPFGRLDLIVLD